MQSRDASLGATGIGITHSADHYTAVKIHEWEISNKLEGFHAKALALRRRRSFHFDRVIDWAPNKKLCITSVLVY